MTKTRDNRFLLGKTKLKSNIKNADKLITFVFTEWHKYLGKVTISISNIRENANHSALKNCSIAIWYIGKQILQKFHMTVGTVLSNITVNCTFLIAFLIDEFVINALYTNIL